MKLVITAVSGFISDLLKNFLIKLGLPIVKNWKLLAVIFIILFSSAISYFFDIEIIVRKDKHEECYVPKGYKDFISNEYAVAFAYPKNLNVKTNRNAIRLDPFESYFAINVNKDYYLNPLIHGHEPLKNLKDSMASIAKEFEIKGSGNIKLILLKTYDDKFQGFDSINFVYAMLDKNNIDISQREDIPDQIKEDYIGYIPNKFILKFIYDSKKSRMIQLAYTENNITKAIVSTFKILSPSNEYKIQL